jgi:pyrroloquinoline quinone biosynthesis protein D
MSERSPLGETSVPQLSPGVRLQHDKRREQWVLQAPERLFVLDQIALEIIKRCDGEATLGAIVDDLAAAFSAPRTVVLKDVQALLQDFVDKRVMAA